MTYRWSLTPLLRPEQVEALQADLSRGKKPFPRALAEILVRRSKGETADARTFFTPEKQKPASPWLMKGMRQAVDRLQVASEERQSVMVYGDYDVDGVTSVSMFAGFLNDWGFQTSYYIPDRYREGYGLSYVGIDAAIVRGCKLIVTLDCGIQAVEKVRYAACKGVDVIICDHHTPGKELPEAVAVLDPKQADCPYPFKELTGCGVGLRLAEALQDHLVGQGWPLPEPDYSPAAKYADLIALSIACDIVPIEGENRSLVQRGISKLRENPISGLRALMEKTNTPRSWDVSDLVFFLGPQVNAVGRLGKATEGVALLMGEPGVPERASMLFDFNQERKSLDKLTAEEALSLLRDDPEDAQKHTTVLYQPHWHKGVVGIVASRLIETHFRPTILLTGKDGLLTGSARSVHGFDLYAALDACREVLVQFGGHKYAAGLTLREDQLEAFKKRFEEVVAATILPEQLIPEIVIDATVGFGQIDAHFMKVISAFEPFGPGNMRPVFATLDAEVLEVNVMKSEHLRLRVRQENVIFDAIGFFLASKWNALGKPDKVALAFQPDYETWQGETRLRLRIKDLCLPACLSSEFFSSASSLAQPA